MNGNSKKYITISYDKKVLLHEIHNLGIGGYEYALKMNWAEWYAHFKCSSFTVYADFKLMSLFDKMTRNENLEYYTTIGELKAELGDFTMQKNKDAIDYIDQEINLLKLKINKLEAKRLPLLSKT